MRVLIAHTHYQHAGGEGIVVEREGDLLTQHGHEVIAYHRSNAEVSDMSFANKLTVPLRMTWARDAAATMRNMIERHRPDIIHIHNTHFMMSPAVIDAAAQFNIPIVQTLHNFRLLCPAGTFFRDGRPCEQCLQQPVPIAAMQHACYRDSRSQSAALAFSTTFHRMRGTWSNVHHFITPTEFARQKLIEAGFDAERITAKPHFLEEPPAAPALDAPPARYIVFVGRFSDEKGALFLLRSWRQLPDVPLKMIGDGPLMDEARALIADNPQMNVELLGRIPRDEVSAIMRDAYALVFPSECYETFGLVAVEAFAVGTPVIAAGHGAPAEIVQDGETGLHFIPSEPDDLAEKVRHLWAKPQLAAAMRPLARVAFEQHYTAAANYPLLMQIYERAKAQLQEDTRR